MLGFCVSRWESGSSTYFGSATTLIFFFSFPPPTCSLFIFCFFFHQDAYKCFPFIIFLNINAPIFIIRKPTLFLCSFHNNDNKCFVGYFWKLKTTNACTPHTLDIAEIYLIISLCRTFAEPFNNIFLFVKSSCALVSRNTNKSLRPREQYIKVTERVWLISGITTVGSNNNHTANTPQATTWTTIDSFVAVQRVVSRWKWLKFFSKGLVLLAVLSIHPLSRTNIFWTVRIYAK